MPASTLVSTALTFSKAVTRACLNTASASLSARISKSPGRAQLSAGASTTLYNPYEIFGEKLMARLPGSVHGVVVQITTEAPQSLKLKARAVALRSAEDSRSTVATGNFTHT